MKAEKSPFTIGPLQTVIHGDVVDYAHRFAECPAMVFASALDPLLLERLVRGAEQAQYADDTVEQLGERGIEAPARIGPACAVLLDRPELRDWLRLVCRTPVLGRVVGRVVETRPGYDGGLRWHDDLIDPRRRIGIVVNLTSAAYEGGDFELRRKGDLAPLCTFHHASPG
ncbi:MAG: hypothetical protein IE933_14430, partial [Sphingomonadales bacterium]|nr:hypothetical protein [Sphingomonadales bacterium]